MGSEMCIRDRDVFALIERELRQYKFDSAAMKTVEALDGKL